MAVRIGYCTNVHPATSAEMLLQQWRKHAVVIRQKWSFSEPMGLGVWLPAQIVRQVRNDSRLGHELKRFLVEHALLPFTCNGFPYGDFHREIVKHDVYFPTWWDERRGEYTLELAKILHDWLPEGESASISTLPISWGSPVPSKEEYSAAARQLLRVARELAALEETTGRYICVAIEPEPGCALQTSRDVIAFFENFLFPESKSLTSRYLTVCHDVCHTAVMFETQSEVLRRYHEAGIGIGKVQVSSAVRMMLDEKNAEERNAAWSQLHGFNEPKYLHQTVVRSTDGSLRFFQDLPLALGYYPGVPPHGEWRVHFHVPIFLSSVGALLTSREDISMCLKSLRGMPFTEQFEVETYAWGVLPEHLRSQDLADGIAAELDYFLAQWKSLYQAT